MQSNSEVLGNIRVVDFTHIYAGPFATQILGDLGADVIKVEPPKGDDSRAFGVGIEGPKISPGFIALNRNKRSLTLDLNDAHDHELALALISNADVVVENFRSGVMEKWGLDYGTLAADNPRLVYCSITGFGRAEDWRSKAANDLIIQAYSGLLSMTGEPGGNPVRVGPPVCDLTTGLYAALAVLGALLFRERTGQGQLVEVSMLESQVSFLGTFLADYLMTGVVPERMGTANKLGLPNQAFPTSDGWVVIAAGSERMWPAFCDALGQPGLANDSRFATLPLRYKHREELVQIISELTVNLSVQECISKLDAKGVTCGPILDISEVAELPVLRDAGTFVDVKYGESFTGRVVGSPLHLSRSPTSTRRGVPLLGEDSAALRAEAEDAARRHRGAAEPVAESME